MRRDFTPWLRLLRIVMGGAVILLTISLTWAQAPDPETIFPTDSKSPQQAGGAALLQAVCPGAVATNKGIGCVAPCPDNADFAKENFPWSLESVTFGHFLSATSEDAALWMAGCESHSSNFGGTILLTRRSQKWTMLWYKPAIQTAQCHKVLRSDRREILVCIATDGGQGNNFTDLYVENLLNPKPTLMAGHDNDGTFFGAFDDTTNCGWQQGDKEPGNAPVIRSHIDKVEFSARSGSYLAPSITVTASFGKKQMTRDEVDACMAGQKGFLPATKAYRMDFLFDGQAYKPAPSSAETVRIFSAR